ncbi:hypothetical protein NS201_17680 [Pseudomonas oryzihabitans]|nr:hypothetical protein NS201_17680 [Pseudomonas psychrotolerans]
MKLTISGVTKRFDSVTALDNVSLEIPSGKFVCFLGPSGCGKTTLLRIIAGLDEASAGRIEVDGKDVLSTTAKERNFGIVFQSYSLFPTLTAAQNVAYGLECRSWKKTEMAERVAAMLKMVHLDAHAKKLPHQLSGGQQQRIALARAIAPQPSLLLLDEPLSALDAKVREELRTEIKAVQEKLGITTIMVTHDQEEALAMADLVVLMRNGRVEQAGTPDELYERPRTAFVAEFIGRMNFLDVETDDQGRSWLGQAPLRLREVGPQGGSRVCLRPEHVELGSAERTGENVVAGRVTDISYLGNLTRITMQPATGGSPVVAELHGRRAPVRLDDSISMHLPMLSLRRLS